MTREEAKDLFSNDQDAYGKPKHIMDNIDAIYDSFEKATSQNREQTVGWIAQRITDEHRKHSRNLPDEWAQLAASKIFASHFTEQEPVEPLIRVHYITEVGGATTEITLKDLQHFQKRFTVLSLSWA